MTKIKSPREDAGWCKGKKRGKENTILYRVEGVKASEKNR